MTHQPCAVLAEGGLEVGVFPEVVFELTPQHHTVRCLEVRLHLVLANFTITTINEQNSLAFAEISFC